MKHFKVFFAALFILAVVVSGCNKDESNPVINDPTTDRNGSYVGTLADQAGGGAVTMNVGVVAKVVEILPVSGVFRPVAGGTVVLTGTYNTTNDSIHVSGGGYTFAGRFGGGQISGTCIGPNGAGIWTVAVSTASNPVKVFTGEFSVPAEGDSGPFNLTITGSTVSVIAFNRRNNETGQFTGTAQGNTLTVQSSEQVVATGSISGDGLTVSGQTVNSSGQPTGTWSGALVQ